MSPSIINAPLGLLNLHGQLNSTHYRLLFLKFKKFELASITKDPIIQIGLFVIGRIDFFAPTLTIGTVNCLKTHLMSTFLLIASRYEFVAGNRQYLISAIKSGLQGGGLVIGVMLVSYDSFSYYRAGAYHLISVMVNRAFGRLKFILCFANSVGNLPAGYDWSYFVIGTGKSLDVNSLELIRELFRLRSKLGMLSYGVDERSAADLLQRSERSKKNLFDDCVEGGYDEGDSNGSLLK